MSIMIMLDQWVPLSLSNGMLAMSDTTVIPDMDEFPGMEVVSNMAVISVTEVVSDMSVFPDEEIECLTHLNHKQNQLLYLHVHSKYFLLVP